MHGRRFAYCSSAGRLSGRTRTAMCLTIGLLSTAGLWPAFGQAPPQLSPAPAPPPATVQGAPAQPSGQPVPLTPAKPANGAKQSDSTKSGDGAKPGATVPSPAVAPVPSQSDIALVNALRAGGHAIVMRHAPADPEKFDADPRNFKNIRQQQPLTEAGQLAARAFGDWLRAAGIPVGEVLTSRFHRAFQTAVLAGFRDAKPVTELTEGSLVASPNEQRRRTSAMKQMMVAPLTPGTNRILVTHRVNMMHALGKEWYDVREGEASIFRVENGNYSLVARVQLPEWQRIAAVPR